MLLEDSFETSVPICILLLYSNSLSRKIKEDLGMREKKANIVSQQCVVYIVNVTCVMWVTLAIQKGIYIRG